LKPYKRTAIRVKLKTKKDLAQNKPQKPHKSDRNAKDVYPDSSFSNSRPPKRNNSPPKNSAKKALQLLYAGIPKMKKPYQNPNSI
jgi:hypothetical protein